MIAVDVAATTIIILITMAAGAAMPMQSVRTYRASPETRVARLARSRIYFASLTTTAHRRPLTCQVSPSPPWSFCEFATCAIRIKMCARERRQTTASERVAGRMGGRKVTEIISSPFEKITCDGPIE